MEPENHKFVTTSFVKPKCLGSIFIVRSAPPVSFFPKKKDTNPGPFQTKPGQRQRHFGRTASYHPVVGATGDMMSRIHDGDTRLSCHASNLPILRVLAFRTSCAGVAKRLRKALANGPQKVEVQNLGGWLLSLVSQMSQCSLFKVFETAECSLFEE